MCDSQKWSNLSQAYFAIVTIAQETYAVSSRKFKNSCFIYILMYIEVDCVRKSCGTLV